MVQRNIGDRVRLIGAEGSLSTFGSLNIYFLREEGVTPDTLVEIVGFGDAAPHHNYIAKLPSGYRVNITERDIWA